MRNQEREKDFKFFLSCPLPLTAKQWDRFNGLVAHYGMEQNVVDFVERVCNTSDARLIYDLAQNFYKADINELSFNMAETLNPEYIFRFALDFGDADQQVLLDGLLDCGDEYYLIKSFFENKNLDKRKQIELAENIIKNNNPDKVIRFIKNKLGTKNEFDYELCKIFSKVLVKNSEYETVKKYATNLPLEMKIISLGIAACRSQNPALKPQDIILDFAKNVAGADKKILSELLIEYGDVKGLYHFATEIEGADIHLIAKEISKNWWLNIKGEAMADIDFRYGIVPDYDEKKYNSLDDYHEDLLIKLKKYKQTDYYKTHKNLDKTENEYHARVMSKNM